MNVVVVVVVVVVKKKLTEIKNAKLKQSFQNVGSPCFMKTSPSICIYALCVCVTVLVCY